MIGYSFRALTGRSALRRRLTKHFRGTPLQQIVTAARTFPTASRVDIQSALNDFFARKSAYQLFGIHSILGRSEERRVGKECRRRRELHDDSKKCSSCY